MTFTLSNLAVQCVRERHVLTRKIVQCGRERLETSPWKCRKQQAQEKSVTEHASFEVVREVFDGRVISRGLWLPRSPD